RCEVEALLAADARSTVTPLERPLQHLPGWMSEIRVPAPLEAGARIGRFVVRRLLAVGGMGAVYEAEQLHPRRTVALKLMRRGLTSRQAVRRFDHECRTLARLHHPHVARIFDADVHDDGNGPAPWFAMEYIVDARTIVEYAAGRGAGVRERIELIMQVC